MLFRGVNIAKCAIEKAYQEKKINFKKPISCHLIPVRITEYEEFDAINYEELNDRGYSKKLLNEKINKFISLPVFLFLMVILASIFTLGTFKNKPNFFYVLIAILTCVAIYYFKDLSIALGQTERISLTLSVWMPIIIISLFCSIGVIQINEK